MYHFLDWFFVFFHAFVTLFNLLGWIWKKTRIANLCLLILTGLSWTVLGIWYGIGYCPLTDWHWQVLHKLGQNNLPNSYIKYLIDRLTGCNVDAGTTDTLVSVAFIFAILMSISLNIRDYRKKLKRANSNQ